MGSVSSSGNACESVTRKVLFPGCRPATYAEGNFPNNLVWLPSTRLIPYKVPCLLFKTESKSDLLVVMSHGNATDIGSYNAHVRNFVDNCKTDVLLWEYPGYGICGGTPSVGAINNHLDHVWDYVENQLKVPASRVVLFGHSIGTGPTLELNARLEEKNKKVAGIILQSPYKSIEDVGRDHVGSFASVITEGWNNYAKMSKVTCPFLVFHGEKDKLIHIGHAHALMSACRSTNKLLVTYPNGDHNNLNYQDMFKNMRNFITNIRTS